MFLTQPTKLPFNYPTGTVLGLKSECKSCSFYTCSLTFLSIIIHNITIDSHNPNGFTVANILQLLSVHPDVPRANRQIGCGVKLGLSSCPAEYPASSYMPLL